MDLKNYILSLAALVSMIALPAVGAADKDNEIARIGGGARGGGAARGGGHAAGHHGVVTSGYSRTPTMSRADRASSQVNRTPANRVAPGFHQPAIQRGGDGSGGQRMIGPGVQRQSQNRADFQNQVRQQVRQANPGRTQNFRNNYSNVRQTNLQHANNVRSALRNTRPAYNNYFRDGFFNRYNYRPNWYTPGYNAWAGSNWGYVNSWLDYGWSTPLYYDDTGDYADVPAEYVSGSASAQPPAQGNWLPLGVFAASQNANDAAYTNMFVQLVVDRGGTLSGTYYNAAADQVHPLDGFVDKDSQQAVWRVADNNESPVMTAGMYNLTQDIADVKVRYSNGNEQYWTFVRLTQ